MNGDYQPPEPAHTRIRSGRFRHHVDDRHRGSAAAHRRSGNDPANCRGLATPLSREDPRGPAVVQRRRRPGEGRWFQPGPFQRTLLILRRFPPFGSLSPLPPSQRSWVHLESPGHRLLAQPELPPNPGQLFPGRPHRVEGAVAEEFDDLRPVGEVRSGLFTFPNGNATLCHADSLPHLLLEESQLKPSFPEVVCGRP